MKETEYTDAMGRIRKEYITEAMEWDGAERRRSRTIRRMTLSIGAVAASIVAVVGVIAYSARGKQTPQPLSSVPMTPAQPNFLGGTGEIKPYCDGVFRDDTTTYLRLSEISWDPKLYVLSENGAQEKPDAPVLFTDGERIYQAEDIQLSVIDSSGEKTHFFALTEDCPEAQLCAQQVGISTCFLGVRHLSGDYYAISYSSPLSSHAPGYTVIYNAAEKRVVRNSADSQMHDEILPVPDGTGWYTIVMKNDHAEVQRYNYSEPEQCAQVINLTDEYEMLEDWTVAGTSIYFTTNSPSVKGASYRCLDLRTGTVEKLTESSGNSRLYLTGNVLYELGASRTEFWIMKRSVDATEGQEIFRAPVSEFLPEEEYAYRLTDTSALAAADDKLYFILYRQTAPGVLVAEIDLASGKWKKYDITNEEANQEDPADRAGYVTANGRCSDLYIPAEHLAGNTKIECYRMLPLRDAAHSAFDQEALTAAMGDIAVVWNAEAEDSQTATMTEEEVREIIASSKTIEEAQQRISQKLPWRCSWGSGVDYREFWMDPQGKELLRWGFVDTAIGIVYLRFDETAGQYYYECLTVPDDHHVIKQKQS